LTLFQLNGHSNGIVVFTIWYRETFGLFKVIQLAMKVLIAKANDQESKLLGFSREEIFLLNLLFRKNSFQFQDIANHMVTTGELDVKSSRDLSPT
jgi:hypothetical protein